MNKKSWSTIAIAAAISASAGSSFAMQVEYERNKALGASYQMLAETQGMERRQDRRDVRQDARQEEGLVGKDKRDAKQEGRQDAREDRQDGDN
jgi:predicted KAP-like P-loop ATPase